MKNKTAIRKGRAGIIQSGSSKFVKIQPDSHADFVMLKSIDDYITFDQHTIWNDDGISPTFVCIGSDEGCPGCKMGNRATAKTLIPVFDVVAKALKILIAGPSIAVHIAECAEEVDVKGRMFRIKRKGSGKNTRYTVILLNKKANVDKVKCPNLEESVPPSTISEIKKLLRAAEIDTDVEKNEDDE